MTLWLDAQLSPAIAAGNRALQRILSGALREARELLAAGEPIVEISEPRA